MKEDIDLTIDEKKLDFEKSRKQAVETLEKLKDNPDIDLFCEVDSAVGMMKEDLAILEFIKQNFYSGEELR